MCQSKRIPCIRYTRWYRCTTDRRGASASTAGVATGDGKRPCNASAHLSGGGRFLISGVQLLVMQKEIKTLIELEEEAKRFVATLVPKGDGATLVTLAGELGAGKTAFVKAVAKALGIEEVVTSPTFVLEKIYKLGSSTSKFERLIHIDAYRLEKSADLAPLGFDELMKDSGNLILLEWPERVSGALPSPTITISFIVNREN